MEKEKLLNVKALENLTEPCYCCGGAGTRYIVTNDDSLNVLIKKTAPEFCPVCYGLGKLDFVSTAKKLTMSELDEFYDYTSYIENLSLNVTWVPFGECKYEDFILLLYYFKDSNFLERCWEVSMKMKENFIETKHHLEEFEAVNLKHVYTEIDKIFRSRNFIDEVIRRLGYWDDSSPYVPVDSFDLALIDPYEASRELGISWRDVPYVNQGPIIKFIMACQQLTKEAELVYRLNEPDSYSDENMRLFSLDVFGENIFEECDSLDQFLVYYKEGYEDQALNLLNYGETRWQEIKNGCRFLMTNTEKEREGILNI